ncbi:lytic transglycosylase domain-containing protein [Clostridium sp. D2Q-11]|uniref:Lytic transglycosylase domain-containing protein n=1 Tax=Anaeromonas frigoriresistens TaxID=2683708 RepID=A0A942UUU3_9FIRM|nr:lytic transglycosylase domain-containing protein [Anaeromonas frigoriresistens]MBS4537199.1 lytic transglycosylase domain-containing protein [Anaeromonas frigoriresistens]
MNKRKSRRLIIFIILLTIVIVGFNIKNIGRIIYPLNYKDYILIYSDKYNIDPNLIASIIDVESNFNEEAVSPKGAIGLMQILPETAKWIAEQNDMKEYEDWMLYKPDINIKMGVWYVDNLLMQFKDLDLALAAYNGGSGNVTKWLQDKKYSEDGKELKDIPFKETKDYVKKVKFKKKIYKFLYDL